MQQHSCGTNHNQSSGGSVMTTSSLNNNHNKIYAECTENLIKAEALIDFALQNNISEVSSRIIHDYLWAVSDFIRQAKQAVEALSNLIE